MARYRMLPTAVDAEQFTGGEENAKALSAWLYGDHLDFSAFWNQENLLELPGKPSFLLPEEFLVFVREDTTPVYKTQWIVKQMGQILIVDDVIFKRKYERI